LEKRTKKLLRLEARVAPTRAPGEQEFLLLFAKKRALLIPGINHLPVAGVPWP
jgi:hypothetical protein